MKVLDELTPELMQWIKEQHMFFIASAPLNGKHINVSPKGLSKTFNLVSSTSLAYLDRIGSGSETISHINEPGNARLCIMFCGYDGPPRIVRLHCFGEYIKSGTPEFNTLVTKYFSEAPCNIYRGIVLAKAFLVSVSCGKGVPFYDFVKERPDMTKSIKSLSKGNKFKNQIVEWNKESLDQLPGSTHSEFYYVMEKKNSEKIKTGNRIYHYSSYELLFVAILICIIVLQQIVFWGI